MKRGRPRSIRRRKATKRKRNIRSPMQVGAQRMRQRRRRRVGR